MAPTHPPWHHSTPNIWRLILLKHLEVQNKSYMKQCLVAARDLKRKIKKEIRVKIEEVCGRVVTTHPWCHVELQWCDFVRVSLPPGVVEGWWCYRVPCLSEVIHVLASRSWWGCKGEERRGRATAAHWRRGKRGGGGINGLPGEMGRGLLAASKSRGLWAAPPWPGQSAKKQ